MIYDFGQIVEFIKNAKTMFDRAKAKALVRTVLEGERMAKRNAIENFTGRNNRRLSGGLLNAIYSSVVVENGDPAGFVGVRNIPYARIHEYGSAGLPGGVIRPKKAKKLWIPNHPIAGRMTPREFVNLMKGDPRRYDIFGHATQIAARWTGGYNIVDGEERKVWSPIFWLVNRSKIPARPYLTPAVEKAVDGYALTFAQVLASEGK